MTRDGERRHHRAMAIGTLMRVLSRQPNASIRLSSASWLLNRVMTSVLVLVALVLGAACRDSGNAPRAGEPAPARQRGRFVIAASDSVVIAESVAGQVEDLGCGEPPIGLSGFWIPAARDLAALEAALPTWLESHIDTTELPRSREFRLNRQYVGMHRAGRRVVLINSWLKDDGPGRGLTGDQLFMSCGGGSSSFRLLFDVEAGSFSGFQANGPI
jgi:hypothetical protein